MITFLLEAVEASEGAKASKGSKITTEDFRVIQALEFSLFECSERNIFFGRIMKYQVEF